MTFARKHLTPLLLFSLVLLSFLPSFPVHGHPQVSEPSRQKSLEVNELDFNYIDDLPDYVRFRLLLSVPEDSASAEFMFFPAQIENARREPDVIRRDLLDRYNRMLAAGISPVDSNPYYRFAFQLVDSLPAYVTEAQYPDPPFLEDNMWMLDQNLSQGERFRREMESQWRPYWQTFRMDGPFRMNVYYIGNDGKVYTGLIDIAADAIGPYDGAVKMATLQPQNSPAQFRLEEQQN